MNNNLPSILTEVAKQKELEAGVSTLITMLHRDVNDILAGKLNPELQKQVDTCFINLELNTNAIAGALETNVAVSHDVEV